MVARVGDAGLVKQVTRVALEQGLKNLLTKQNAEGNTPLHIAAKMKPLNLAVVSYLHFANTKALQILNEDEKRPGDVAVEAGYTGLHLLEKFQLFMRRDLVKRGMDESEDEVKSTTELRLATEFAQRKLQRDITVIWYKDRRTGLTLISNWRRCAAMADIELDAWRRQLHGTLDVEPFSFKNKHEDEDKMGNSKLVQTAYEYQVDSRGISPLYLAVKKGSEDNVKGVFQATPALDVSLSIKELLFAAQKKKSLANAAIKSGNLGILKALMEELPELLNIPDYRGWRPLSYAAYRGHMAAVSYLLTKIPASAKNYDEDGSLPIHKAVGGGHVSVVKLFQEHSPQTLYDLDKNGQTILHFGVKCAKGEVLRYLKNELEETILKIYNIKDKNGRTFTDLANEHLASISTCATEKGPGVDGAVRQPQPSNLPENRGEKEGKRS